MATLEPSVALSTCESALRGLMAHAYSNRLGSDWLDRVSTPEQRAEWSMRASSEAEVRVPKGVAQVPNAGLAYSDFRDLVDIAEKHWEPLAAALGKLSRTLPLLRRFENLRNSIGHSRSSLPFEQDLMSGIAGQIRNQVTLHMSTQDDAGDFYPRIESVTDSFGRRIESSVADGEIAGAISTYDVTLHPGDVVTFTCVGHDPQNRQLHWKGHLAGEAVGASGEPTPLQWLVADSDVSETVSVEIYLTAMDTPYHRFRSWDHRVYFSFRVRPPLVPTGSSIN